MKFAKIRMDRFFIISVISVFGGLVVHSGEAYSQHIPYEFRLNSFGAVAMMDALLNGGVPADDRQGDEAFWMNSLYCSKNDGPESPATCSVTMQTNEVYTVTAPFADDLLGILSLKGATLNRSVYGLHEVGIKNVICARGSTYYPRQMCMAQRWNGRRTLEREGGAPR